MGVVGAKACVQVRESTSPDTDLLSCAYLVVLLVAEEFAACTGFCSLLLGEFYLSQYEIRNGVREFWSDWQEIRLRLETVLVGDKLQLYLNALRRDIADGRIIRTLNKVTVKL